MKGATMKKIGLALLIFFAVLPAAAELPGAIFVNTEMGARSIGMGRSYAAIAEGGEAFIYNIGGSAFFDQKEIFFNYQQLEFFEQDNSALSFFLPVPALHGTLGLNILYFNEGSVDATGEGGENLNSFDVYQMVVGLTYGAKISEHWGGGIALKYVQDHLHPDHTGNAVAMDIGALYRNEKELSPLTTFDYGFGASIQNIGTKISYQDQEQADPLPRYLRTGVRGTLGYEPWNMDVTMSLGYDMDLVELFTDNGSFHWGCELGFLEMLFIRGGYYTNNYNEESAFNWGLGFSYMNISLDFAMDNLYKLDSANGIYSLRFRF
jgi:hypothetical protein